MTTIIKTEKKKSMINKYRVDANITDFLKINILTMTRQLCHIKMYILFLKMNMYKMDIGTFCQNYRVATLSSLYLTVSEIIIPSLKLRGQFLTFLD